MLVLSILALTLLFSIGAISFIECKIVDDLPDSNGFKKWWRAHIITPNPRG